MQTFSTLDLVIFIAYACLILFTGLFVSRTRRGADKDSQDYFLAGKSLSWWAIGASIIASNISAEQFIGMSGSGFAIGLGIAIRKASDTTRLVMNDIADGVEFIVRIVIRCAPIGIFGLVASTFATEGLELLVNYAQLLILLVGSMLFVALVLNPLIVWFCIRKNPYPLTFQTLRESGITAFFTRSSAANIPVNLNLCKRLGLDESVYLLSIPLGATINMAGAAITITTLSLAAGYTMGVAVDIPTAILLCVVASLCACGAAGVPGGSLMLIPLACSLFGLDSNIAMQVVAVGFVIGVVQDSCETALNSSSDVLFTAAACMLLDCNKAQRQAEVQEALKDI